MLEIIVRCGYGEFNELGTGHLNRTLNIIKFLKKKNNINSAKILFVLNNSSKNLDAKKLIKKLDKNIKVHILKKTQVKNSLDFLNKLRSKLIIIDTLSNFSSYKLKIIKKKCKKIILIDDYNFNSKEFDLRINPLIFKKNIETSKKMIGFKFNLLSVFFNNIRSRKIKNKIFIFFGGYDHNKYTLKILSILKKNNINSKQFYFDEKYKSKEILKLKNIKFYKRSNFYLHLASCEKVLCSGGLIAFDSIHYNKNVYCLPQFNHQRINIKKLEKLGLVKCISVNDIKSILNDSKKTYYGVNKIFKKKEMFKTFLKINSIYQKAIN